MSKRSRDKGCRGEREFCKILGKLVGVDALQRNLEQCRNGGCDTHIKGESFSDQQSHIVQQLSQFSIEIKRYAHCDPADISQWWKQAVYQAERNKKRPLLAFRLDRQRWQCLVHAGRHEINDVTGCIRMDVDLLADFLRNPDRTNVYPL